MDMKAYVTEKLKELTKEKDDNHIVPNHILANDLFNSVVGDVKKTLNIMNKEKTIEVCKTLNNLGIKFR